MIQLTEKYKPTKLDDIIMLPRIEAQIKGAKHLLLYGKHGMGKTTLARVLSNSSHGGKNPNVRFYSGSNVNMETLRNDLELFTNPNSLFGRGQTKFVIVDEFDEAPTKFINAIRPFIEAKETNTRFIFTANLDNLATPKENLKGVYDRFTQIKYAPIDKEESKFLLSAYGKRMIEILKNEGIEIKQEDKYHLKKIIENKFPSFRGCLKTLDSVVANGGDFSKIVIGNRELYADVIEVYDLLTKPTPQEIALYVYENIFENEVMPYYKTLQSEQLIKHIIGNHPKVDLALFLSTIKTDVSLVLSDEVLSYQTMLITTLCELHQRLRP